MHKTALCMSFFYTNCRKRSKNFAVDCMMWNILDAIYLYIIQQEVHISYTIPDLRYKYFRELLWNGQNLYLIKTKLTQFFDLIILFIERKR